LFKKRIKVFAIFVAAPFFFPLKALTALNFGTLVPDLNSAYGGQVDSLYGSLFWLVTILFIATQGALLLFVFLFRKKQGRKARYSHGHPAAEWIWTLIPIVILSGLYFYQKKLWDFMRGPMPLTAHSQTIQVFAEQFAWHFRYAGPDGLFGTADDIMTVNQMHVRAGENVQINESAKDVIHSFFVPQARLKQDAVPGMLSKTWFELDKVACWDLKKQQNVFFTPDEMRDKKVALEGFALTAQKLNVTGEKSYRYDPFPGLKKIDILYEGRIQKRPVAEADYVQCPIEIACSQLCGIGHYRMIGYLYVDTPETYARWFNQAVKDKKQDDAGKWTRIWDQYYPQFNAP
jgi:cytochrome c oxidase subunit 2